MFEDNPILASKLANSEKASRRPCRCSSFFATVAKPDLTRCIELLVIETHVVCSNNANKIPTGGCYKVVRTAACALLL